MLPIRTAAGSRLPQLFVSAIATPTTAGAFSAAPRRLFSTRTISYPQVKALLASKTPYTLLDVRNPSETDLGVIPTAVVVPLGEVATAFALPAAEFEAKYGFAKPKSPAKNSSGGNAQPNDAKAGQIVASEATAFLHQDRRALADYYADFGVPPRLQHYDPAAPLSPFASSETVIEEKRSTKRRRETPAMRWGARFEPVALDIYSRLHDRAIEPFGLLTHDGAHPWLGASVDGIEHGTGMVIEVKCPMRPVAETWGPDDLPEPHYWVQVQIQLEVLALPAAWLYTSHFVEYADALDFLSDPITPRLAGCILIPLSNRKPRAIKPTTRTPNPPPSPPPAAAIYPPSQLLVLDNSSDENTAQRAQLLAWVEHTCDPQTHRPQFWYLDRSSRKWIGRSRRWFSRVAGVLERAHGELEAGGA
ncbi:hypothetical protein HDU89_003010 [Geranomyces variabilis]|nr:hypothetical protein HDU89_003010 [Geranomyces variabilis]